MGIYNKLAEEIDEVDVIIAGGTFMSVFAPMCSLTDVFS